MKTTSPVASERSAVECRLRGRDAVGGRDQAKRSERVRFHFELEPRGQAGDSKFRRREDQAAVGLAETKAISGRGGHSR